MILLKKPVNILLVTSFRFCDRQKTQNCLLEVSCIVADVWNHFMCMFEYGKCTTNGDIHYQKNK